MSLPKKRQSSRPNQMKIFYAITENDISSVKSILCRGSSLGSLWTYNRTALHIAASVENEAIVDILLKAKAQVTALDKHNNTPLHFAAENGNINIFMKLLNAPPENGGPMIINVSNNQLEIPLHCAVYNGHVALVEKMIAAGADVNAKKLDNGTPLHLAAAMGNAQIVQLLLRYNANPNQLTRNGSSPLHCAIFDRLYDKSEFPYHRMMTRTKLNDVEIAKQKEVVQILLNSGANPNKLNSKFVSPLICAVRRNHLVLMRTLLEGGASVDLLNSNGETALHQAAEMGTPEAIR